MAKKRKPALFDPEKFVAAFEASAQHDAAGRMRLVNLALAEHAVVKAAMEFWRVGKLGPDEWHEKINAADAEFDAACAALAKLEGK